MAAVEMLAIYQRLAASLIELRIPNTASEGDVLNYRIVAGYANIVCMLTVNKSVLPHKRSVSWWQSLCFSLNIIRKHAYL
ncbi:hypothetical protein AM501_01425 [Aneurinibacillus migulanus]|nr:hypothetical protein TS64_04600 [Aneurinibacillus migulanus]KPD09940.1 hypothetical protein AM501_01425 [Aneurinibacillus migulanus]